MSRKRLILAAAMLVPVLTAVAVLLADMIGASPRTVLLADGRVLTVRGISSGTSHRFVYGNPWQRIATLVVPDRWAQKLGAETFCRVHDRSNSNNLWSINYIGVINEAGSVWVPGSQVGAGTTTNTLLRFTGRLGTNTLWKLRLALNRPPTPDFDKLSKRSVPYERTIELIAQPTAAP